MPFAQPGTNPFLAAQHGLGMGMQTTAGLTGFRPGTIAGMNLQPYWNPYTSMVVDQSLGAMDRARQMAMSDIGARATAANAFGGARHGLYEAETNRSFADEAGRLAAGLYQGGFDRATSLAQQDINNRLAGAQFRLGAAGQLANMAGQSFGFGQAVNQNLGQVGAQQRAILDTILAAAQGMFGQMTQQPQTGLASLLAALGAMPQQGTERTSQNPGLLNVFATLLGAIP